jgi:thioredoxin reductase (NADPH)
MTKTTELPPEYVQVAFPRLEDRHLAGLEALGQRRRLTDGSILFQTGETGLGLFIVLAGQVQIFERQEDGEVVIGTAGERQFIGDVAMLTGGAAVLNARAIGETEVLAIPSSDLRRFSRRCPK